MIRTCSWGNGEHLSPATALWVPAGVEHRFWSPEPMVLLDAKFAPARCPVPWTTPTSLAVTPLLAALLAHLADGALARPERVRAEGVLFDALVAAAAPEAVAALVPRDSRARLVAEAVLRDPADDRALEAWGSVVGTSRRTLSRIFREETGQTFTAWRSRARMQIAAARLADGQSVATAARHVGYRDTGAFIAAFRRVHGVTPGRHVRAGGPDGVPQLVAARGRRRIPARSLS